jgi:hypothetical protein
LLNLNLINESALYILYFNREHPTCVFSGDGNILMTHNVGQEVNHASTSKQNYSQTCDEGECSTNLSQQQEGNKKQKNTIDITFRMSS